MSISDEVERVLLSLRGLWDGEAVDELDHALQSAGAAQHAGADDQLILASALHDIGRSPLVDAQAHHDDAARAWLAPRFGARVAWLAGNHVAAKRYLVATDPDYLDGLTPTSRRTLVEQGGAVVDSVLSDHPWWPDALALRRFDDSAKVPGAITPTVQDIASLATRVAL